MAKFVSDCVNDTDFDALNSNKNELYTLFYTHIHLVLRSKNVWSYNSTPQYTLMAWCLVNHRDNFAFN
jgi:hypothetical protein